MAVRTNGSGEYLRRSTNLPSSTAITVAGWCKLAQIRSGQYQYSGLDGSVTNADRFLDFGFSSGGVLQIEGQDGLSGYTEGNFSSQPTANNWFFWAFTCSGTGSSDAKAYWGYPTTGTLVTASTYGKSFTPAILTIGNDSYDEWMDATWAAVKVWDVALSADEIEQERWTIAPQRLSNLNLWSPNFAGSTERLADYSGNGRNWTAGGTLTDEDGPPIRWDNMVWVVAAPPASGNVVIGAAAGSLALAGQQATVQPGAATIACAAGNLSFTGQSAGVAANVTVAVNAGTLVSAGQAATVAPGSVSIAAASGSLAIAGQNATVQPGAVAVNAAAGALAINGQTAQIQAPIAIAVAAGQLALSGQQALVQPGAVSVAASAGLLALTGQPASVFPGAVAIAALAGALTLTGQPAAILTGGVIGVQTGLLALSGQQAAIVPGTVDIIAQAAALALSGQQAMVDTGDLPIMVSAGVLAFSGQSAQVQPGAVSLAIIAGVLALSGQRASLSTGEIAVVLCVIYGPAAGGMVYGSNPDSIVVGANANGDVEGL